MDYPFGPTKMNYRKFPGEAPGKVPENKDFWSASKVGGGKRVLRWGIEEGTYSIAVMNQDASRGLNISGSIGVKIPVMGGLGIGLAVGGLIALLLSFFLIYLAVSRSRISED